MTEIIVPGNVAWPATWTAPAWPQPNGREPAIGTGLLEVRDGVAEIERLRQENAALQEQLAEIRKTHFKLAREFQPYIDAPPVTNAELYQQAAAGDEVTINTWRNQWIAQARQNRETYGSFKARSIDQLLGLHAGGTAIVAGAGPSLQYNADLLKTVPKHVPIVSALHNFAYFHDRGIKAALFVTIDAGIPVLTDLYEGGNKKLDDGSIDKEYYAEATRNHTLIAFTATHPEVLATWRGNIIFFSSPVPDKEVFGAFEELEPNYHHFVSAGGNVLGGATYLTRAVMGASTIIWVGNNQAFAYDKRFYDWECPLNGDVGQSIRWPDIYGIGVHTWPSYFNFKCWFDHVSMKVPGLWINASEGGIVGAYREGNLRSIRQMTLADALQMVTAHEILRPTFAGETRDRSLILF